MQSFDEVLEGAGLDSESLTVLLVAGSSRDRVLQLLGADPESNGRQYPDLDDSDYSGYAAIDVGGGVVAIEHTGYADPSPRVLAALSGIGGSAAVARSNIQAHERFGCACDGELVFDADEFMYVEEHEKEPVPEELRAMFDAAWVDLDSEEDVEDEGQPAGVEVAYAMAVAHTGVAVTGDDLKRAIALGYHRVRTLTYLDE